MNYCGITDKGNVRKINQDVYMTVSSDIKNTVLLVVCDGMGGAKAGNIASEMAAESFVERMTARLSEENTIIDTTQHIGEAVRTANKLVYDRSLEDTDCAGMGTTLVAAAVTDNGTVIVNVGDSRAYHVTAGKITQITKDHSVVEDMIDRGDLTRVEASKHPNRNLITRALGTALDTEPDYFFLNVLNGEHLLLCSDGLSNVVTEQELLTEIMSGSDTQEICKRLIDLTLSRGAPDNVTVVLFSK